MKTDDRLLWRLPSFFHRPSGCAVWAALLTVIFVSSARAQNAAAAKDESPRADSAAPAGETRDARATRLARLAHTQSTAIDALPRFDYQVRTRYGIIGGMEAVKPVTVDHLRAALTAPIQAKGWQVNGWYELGFSWDEKRLIHEIRPGESINPHSTHFGTLTDAWERGAVDEKSRASNYVRCDDVRKFWDTPDHPSGSIMHLFGLSYLRVAPHQYWWGRTVAKSNSHEMLSTPFADLVWKHAGTEGFAEEECEVLHAKHQGFDAKRLWIGKQSGRLRGVLVYFANNQPNELAEFDDYREAAPGVWLPFRETRSYGWVSEKQGHNSVVRSELNVVIARTGVDLTERCRRLLPEAGDPVQDQRFAAPVNLTFNPTQTDEQIRALADAQHQKDLRAQDEFKRIQKPFDAMLGKPAPALPEEGWVGGRRPDVAGKPYVLHFWATWCGPCKADLPRIQALAEKGLLVVGMHPSGTKAAEVERAIRHHKLTYPTFLASAGAGVADGPPVPFAIVPRRPAGQALPPPPIIAGYPAGMFPYCVVVDEEGRVNGHGLLSQMLPVLEGLLPREKAPGAKPGR